jgi:uncharacterized protein (TIGR02271 family)
VAASRRHIRARELLRRGANRGEFATTAPRGGNTAPEAVGPYVFEEVVKMTSLRDVETWRGRTAVDRDGEKIGSIEEIYLDRQSGEPEWIAVKTGLFGRRASFVPIRDAQLEGDDVRVGFEKDKIKDAPNIDADGELSREEERTLYEYYGRSGYSEWTEASEDRTTGVMGADPREARRGEPASTTESTGTSAGVAADTTAGERGLTEDPGGDVGAARAAPGRQGVAAGSGGEDAMTRSEEELRVGIQPRETGRARLRKYVVTEQETKTVPVQREQVRVEREPVTDANIEAATSGPDISEAEHEVTLHAEEPVVEKRVEPKERVRLEKDVETDEQTVSDEVRKERIEPEGDAGDDRP